MTNSDLNDSPTAAAALFQPISLGRMSDHIVSRILELIRDRQLKVGDRLPPERDLTTLFTTSRTSVREALRVLESRGLLTIKVGARGGAFVATPPPSKSSQGVSDMIAVGSMSAADVTEARAVLELGSLTLACERAVDEDIADLLRMCDSHESALAEGRYTSALSLEFHLRLVATAKNPSLDLLAHALREPFLRSLERTQSAEGVDRSAGIKEHREVVNAIKSRDSAKAVELMQRHLERTRRRDTTAD